MLLYVCEKCGTWLDVSLLQAVIDRWNRFTSNQPGMEVKQPYIPLCEGGHGRMRRVTEKDRLSVRLAATPPAAQNIVKFRRPGIELTFVPMTTEELKRLMEERGSDESE